MSSPTETCGMKTSGRAGGFICSNFPASSTCKIVIFSAVSRRRISKEVLDFGRSLPWRTSVAVISIFPNLYFLRIRILLKFIFDEVRCDWLVSHAPQGRGRVVVDVLVGDKREV